MIVEDEHRRGFQRYGFVRSIGLLVGIGLCGLGVWLTRVDWLPRTSAPYFVDAALALAALFALRATLSQLWTRETSGPVDAVVLLADVTGKLMLVIAAIPIWMIEMWSKTGARRGYGSRRVYTDAGSLRVWRTGDQNVRDVDGVLYVPGFWTGRWRRAKPFRRPWEPKTPRNP
jgi:hypothetical protein